MNKIVLDKLSDFALTTYNNYIYENKNFNLEEYINSIKQNQSLNEKGIFLKHNFIELKTLINEIELDQMVLINPLCFNLCGNIEWYNFLNAILTVLNDNYLHESNLIKKTILETADKTFKKKIDISNIFDEVIINTICSLTNITLIILSNKNKIQIYNNNLLNKVIVMINDNKDYYSVLNWNQKYFNSNSEFIEYLKKKYIKYQENFIIENNKNNNIVNNNENKNNFINIINKKKKKNNNDIFDFSDNNIKNKNIDNNTIIKNNIKNNIKNIEDNNIDTYKELQAEENYALYISEVVDNYDHTNKIINSIDKKKKKNDKNIFLINKKNIKNDIEDNKEIKNKENNNDENNNIEDSVFKKTDKIDKIDIDDIIKNIKISMGLEIIQTQALKLGITIFEGSTKTGKPKNKTKIELINQIKKYTNN